MYGSIENGSESGGSGLASAADGLGTIVESPRDDASLLSFSSKRSALALRPSLECALDLLGGFLSFATMAVLGVWLREWMSGSLVAGAKEEISAPTVKADIGLDKYVLPNALGCLVLGFLAHAKLSANFGRAIRTGFCGVLTTYSSAAIMSGLSLMDAGRGLTIQSSMVWLKHTLTGVGSAWLVYAISFDQGKCLAQGKGTKSSKDAVALMSNSADDLENDKGSEPKLPLQQAAAAESPTEISITFAIWTAIACCLAIIAWVRATQEMLLSAAAAVIGASIRWLLAFAFNAPDRFPAGTLLANCAGSAAFALALFYMDGHWAAASFKSGFCGGLSTMSTFIGESHIRAIDPDRRAEAYAYVFLTVFITHALVVTVFIASAPA